MVPPDSYRVSRAPHYSGYHYLTVLYLYRAITVYGYFFQSILVHRSSNVVVLQPQYCRNNTGLGLFQFRSPLLSESLLFSLPPGT